MKKLVLVLVIFFSCFFADLQRVNKGECFKYTLTEQIVRIERFVITAYYSPLRNQRRYVTGSYESECRLQGKGLAARDGTRPYLGMLAADWCKYPRGTKIFVPEYTDQFQDPYGFSTVHDTGGAIKGNRLDLWMGRGDAGRQRALKWGKRTIVCQVLEEVITSTHFAPID